MHLVVGAKVPDRLGGVALLLDARAGARGAPLERDAHDLLGLVGVRHAGVPLGWAHPAVLSGLPRVAVLVRLQGGLELLEFLVAQ